MPTSVPSVKGGALALGLAAGALLCASCGTNPLVSGLPGAGSGSYGKPAEVTTAAGVFFAPQSGTFNLCTDFTKLTPTAQGGAFLDVGTEWIYATAATPGTDATGYYPLSAGLLQQQYPTLTSNSSHYFNNVWLRGGPGGDQFSDNSSDYYVRLEGSYVGSGIPNGSTNYMELPIYFYSNDGPGVDLSAYHGFSFWTRGTGNFSVCLVSGSQAGSPPAPGPYIQLNLYQYLFNTYLTGSSQWRQVVVYFSEMNQTYGLQTNLQTVLSNLYGLQFMQMGSPGPPVQYNFWLDVDYIRFF